MSLLLQEDSSDLKCQLHFAKEESALMCKKLTKLVKDGEAMKEELAKYRSLYGDVDATLTVEEVRTGSRHMTCWEFLESVGFALMCLMHYKGSPIGSFSREKGASKADEELKELI